MKVLAVYNIKGGVGKTATAVNLAFLGAWQGLRTLVWDLDPQAAATYYFRVKPKVKGGKKMIRGKRDVESAIKGTDFERLDLLPSDFCYRNMDLLLGESKKPSAQLLKMMMPVAGDYDLVVLDSPPSISLVSENIFRAANVLLVPTIPTTLSLRTLEQLLDFVEGHELNAPVYSFYSMVDRRKRLHRDIVSSDPDPRVTMLGSVIPYASDVERMGIERRPVMDFAPSSAAGRAYSELWEEIFDVLRV